MKNNMIWPDSFVEHLTGAPGPANEELFFHLVAILPPRRQEAVVLHFHDGLPYKAVGEKQGGISATRVMQQADIGVRKIRERIAMDTGVIPLPVDKPGYGEVMRKIIAGSVEDYQKLIEAKERLRAAAEERALEKHRDDPLESLMLTVPTHRTLMNAGITTVGDLVAKTADELRALGRVNVKNIESRLWNLGLRLSKD